MTSRAFGSTQEAPIYTPQAQVSGTLNTVGSDTMVYLVSYWVVAFKRFYPQVQARVIQAGSATAPPALIDGSANIGPMSRKMKDSEIQSFVKKFGYPPTEIRVAMDGLAVYGHSDNPIPGLTLPQVDAIFSSTRKCNYREDIATWGQLGLNGHWRDAPISLLSRNVISGTYGFFAEHALCKGKFKASIDMQPTSRDVVRKVGEAPGAVGYSGIGYLSDKVRALPLAAAEGQPFVPATAENIYSGKYPLSRYLYIYVNKVPGSPLPTLEREFLRMVLSTRGQSLITVNGFIRLSPQVVDEELAKLN